MWKLCPQTAWSGRKRNLSMLYTDQASSTCWRRNKFLTTNYIHDSFIPWLVPMESSFPPRHLGIQMMTCAFNRRFFTVLAARARGYTLTAARVPLINKWVKGIVTVLGDFAGGTAGGDLDLILFFLLNLDSQSFLVSSLQEFLCATHSHICSTFFHLLTSFNIRTLRKL